MKIFLIILFVAEAVARALLVGQERKPVTPGDAATTIVLAALIIAGIVIFL